MPKRTAIRITKTVIANAKPGQSLWDTTPPGFGVRVLASGTCSFIFQYRPTGGKQTKITIGQYPAMSIDDARRAALDHYARVKEGGNPSLERQAGRKAELVADLADEYCGPYAQARQLKPRTVNDARKLFDRFMIPAIGNRRIVDVSSPEIDAIHGKACKVAGRYQANRLRAAMSRIFNLAIRANLRTSNPCKGVERFPEDQRENHLSPAEVKALLKACDEYGDQNAANAIRLLLLCGGRLQETLKAEWSHMDLERGVWRRPSHHTKTKRITTGHLATEVVEMLREMKATSSSRFLFPGRSGDAPRRDLKRPWAVIQKAAGLSGYCLHDLRRTHASFILSSGYDLATVGRQLGHTQAKTTARYAFLSDDRRRDGVQSAVTAMTTGQR